MSVVVIEIKIIRIRGIGANNYYEYDSNYNFVLIFVITTNNNNDDDIAADFAPSTTAATTTTATTTIETSSFIMVVQSRMYHSHHCYKYRIS